MKFNIRTAATPARSLAAVLLGAGLTVAVVAGPVGATNAAKQEALAAWPATSEDLGKYITNVAAETTMAVVTPKGIAKTGNADEPRPGLSVMKMYIADYVLKSGDKSGRDWYLTQKMLRISDDDAANQLYKKYPEAIAKTAQRYGLWSTVAGDKWGASLTSATDAAVFLPGDAREAFKQTVCAGESAIDLGAERCTGSGTGLVYGNMHELVAVGVERIAIFFHQLKAVFVVGRPVSLIEGTTCSNDGRLNVFGSGVCRLTDDFAGPGTDVVIGLAVAGGAQHRLLVRCADGRRGDRPRRAPRAGARPGAPRARDRRSDRQCGRRRHPDRPDFHPRCPRRAGRDRHRAPAIREVRRSRA